MADGFGYASHSARSSAREAHVQARLAQLAAQRRGGGSGSVAKVGGSQDFGMQFQLQRAQTAPSTSTGAVTATATASAGHSSGRTVSSSGSTGTTTSDWRSIKGRTSESSSYQYSPTSPSSHTQYPYYSKHSYSDSQQSHQTQRSREGSLNSTLSGGRADDRKEDEQPASNTLTHRMALAGTWPSSGMTALADQYHAALLRNPFERRDGRRYLRDVPYPLPCDLSELQRQNLRTLLGCRVFGRAVCAPHVVESASPASMPVRVLELGCGSGYWTAMCHDYLGRARGARNLTFTGLDLAPLAPDLARSGMNFRFVQHDIRRTPLPFDDGAFDLVMVKDMSMALPFGAPFQQLLDECLRVLREGGTIEVWESDHIIRTLAPHPPPAPTRDLRERDDAARSATYCVAPGTPFTPTQNKYLRQANAWIAEALDRRKLTATPCVRIGQLLTQEPGLCAVGSRRVAIPLSEVSWERSSSRSNSGDLHDSPMSTGSRAKGRLANQQLTEEQLALRQTALMTVLQMIEGLEPFLREVSGKNTEEWGNWWASMMTNLTKDENNTLDGESLEMGAWWATKRPAAY